MKRLALTLAMLVLIAIACIAVVPIQPVAVKGTAMLRAAERVTGSLSEESAVS